MSAWAFVATLGVLLAGLALVAAVLGRAVQHVARAVGEVGSALVNPPPSVTISSPVQAGAESTDLTDARVPPWERWPAVSIPTTPVPEEEPGGEQP